MVHENEQNFVMIDFFFLERKIKSDAMLGPSEIEVDNNFRMRQVLIVLGLVLNPQNRHRQRLSFIQSVTRSKTVNHKIRLSE